MTEEKAPATNPYQFARGLNPAHTHLLREKRRLDPVTADQLGVLSLGPGPGDAIGFHYILRGQVHNTKVRRGKGNMPWSVPGRPLIPWNVDSLSMDAHPDEALVICEGELDGVALVMAGFRRVISTPNGAPSRGGEDGSKRYSWLYAHGDTLRPEIDQFKHIIIATDGDAPGQHLRDDIAVRLGDHRCSWVQWPDGCKDANDVLIKHGLTELSNCVLASRRMWLELVASMSDIPDEPDERGLLLGWHNMDDGVEAGGIRIPETGFVTISGPAHMGKSVFTRQLLWHLWRTYQKPFGVTALEERAKPRLQREFRRLAIEKPIDAWTPDDVGKADYEMDYAMKIIRRPPNSLLDVDRLLSTVEYAIKVYSLQVICIDPVNEIDHGFGGKDDKYTDYIGKMIMMLKEIADRFRVLVICVAHPPVDVVRRKKPADPWSLYDVEGSRHWAGKSDAGFCLWRPHPRSPTFCNVPKLKSNEVFGRPNVFRLDLDPAMNTFRCNGAGFRLLDQIGTDLESGIWDQEDDRIVSMSRAM